MRQNKYSSNMFQSNINFRWWPFIHTTPHFDKLDTGIELPGQGDVGLLDTRNLLLLWPLFEASVIGASVRGSHCKILRRLANCSTRADSTLV